MTPSSLRSIGASLSKYCPANLRLSAACCLLWALVVRPLAGPLPLLDFLPALAPSRRSRPPTHAHRALLCPVFKLIELC